MTEMRGRNALAGRMGLWLRQIGDTAEGTLANVLTTLRDFGGYDLLVAKVMDGTTWQHAIDPLTPASSVAAVVKMQEQCEAVGIAFCPVVVPRGADIQREAAEHGAIARAVGCLMTDIEPYAGFFNGGGAGEPRDAVLAQIPLYTRALRQAAGDAYLVNQPDPREFAVTASRVRETALDFNAICAQHYVGWESVGWTDVAAEARRFLALAPAFDDAYVTLYGVERIDLAGQFWDWVRAHATGAHVFALGSMNAEQLRFFGGLPRAVPPMPNPTPSPTPVPAPSDDRAALIDELRGVVDAATDDEVRAAVRKQTAMAKLQALGAA